MQARVQTMTEEIGDTAMLDSTFEGLSSASQGFAVKVLADPTKRVALLQQMPVEVYEELAYFVHAMPEAEQMAVEKALGL